MRWGIFVCLFVGVYVVWLRTRRVRAYVVCCSRPYAAECASVCACVRVFV